MADGQLSHRLDHAGRVTLVLLGLGRPDPGQLGPAPAGHRDQGCFEAARYGIDGKLIDFGKEAEVDERSLLNELLEFVSTEVKELGSEREMAHVERIIREGTGADRQLAAWERTQDTKAVVDHIVAETYEGLSLPE